MTLVRARRSRPHRAVPRLLRESGFFRSYWGAHTISLFGDQVSLLALPLVAVLTLEADAAEMGYLTALALAPNLLFALHAGAWVDRRGRRRQTMIATDVGRAGLLCTVPAAYALDVLTLGQLYGVAFAVGALTVLFGVSDASLFVAIVPRERYVEANSLLNGSRAFSFVAGPSTSGLLVQALSAPGALLLDAFSFLGSGALLARIHPDEPPPDPERGGVLVGLRWVARSSVVRATLLATATINFFNFVFFALFILYATRALDVSPATLGLVLGAGAVGGLVGAAVTGRVTRRIGVGPALIVGCVLFTAPLLLVPLAAGSDAVVLACLFLAEFGSGLGVMLLDISAGSIFAAVIPHRLRSRVSGAYTFVNYGVRVLGSLAGGLLGSAIGLRPALWIGVTGALLGFLWLLPSPVPQLRELPALAEDGSR
ncbi:MAG TPA: MFS transporter [Gaiellaceae bacterium]|nr:MFS transporter [Gaiellaceae bacterium]